MSQPIHHRVTIDEIDAAGVMFAGAIYIRAHRAFEQALHACGLDLAGLLASGEAALPIKRIEVDYHAPIRHGQELAIDVALAERRTSAFRLRIRIADAANGTALATAEQVHVAIGSDGAKRPLPEVVGTALDRLPPT